MIKLKDILKEVYLRESGIRDINKLAKEFKEAVIYFHMDLDGVTTALGMKEYLANYGIKTVDAKHIQYGEREFAAPKPEPGQMMVVVDFAHGKPMAHIHIDHHQSQSGVEKGTSVKFKGAPSNVETMSQEISPRDLFPPQDLKIISMVDTAGYKAMGISVDDVLRSVFTMDKSLGVERNRNMMGLVVNKMLLAFKNKPGFLEALVLKAKPSLVSLYNVIKDEIKTRGLKLADLDKATGTYLASQDPSKKMKVMSSTSEILNLGNGEYAKFGNVLVQYGGGYTTKGGYDRYAPFKAVPDAHYLVIGWGTGLVQASVNPFMEGKNPLNLGDVGKTIISNHKSEWENIEVTFRVLKRSMERAISRTNPTNEFGFTMEDFLVLFQKEVKGLPEWEQNPYKREMLDGISNKLYARLSDEEKAILEDVTVSAYDVVTKSSGGHKNITNISGLNFLDKEFVPMLKGVMIDFVEELKNVKLK